jgi:TPR repeat protein
MSLRNVLSGAVILGVAMHYTGAGEVVWSRMKTLDASCYSGLSRIGASMADPLCGGIAKAVQALDGMGTEVGDRVKAVHQSINQRILGIAESGSIGDLGRVLDDTTLSDRLTRVVEGGPKVIRGGSTAAQFQQATDNFTIGQHFMNYDGGAVTRALPWLQQGASQQGYGVMSQLSLGDLYRKGGAGMDPNPAIAENYYRQAQSSIALLTKHNSPEARALLEQLPLKPQAMMQQIDTALAQMKEGKK